ncbi:MAG: ADP-ribosylglycohydrolase family protein [Phycisphaeraceae bacterium]|nr:ADP-ribosylglycohydrolase family protein [Phycisphaeraceae bacterium]
MSYPIKSPTIGDIGWQFRLFAELKHEQGAKGVDRAFAKACGDVQRALNKLKKMPVDKQLLAREPSDLPTILKLRPRPGKGLRDGKLWAKFDPKQYATRLEGAILARAAGCTLGAIVEIYSPQRMEELAKLMKVDFPPTDYWPQAASPFSKRYGMSWGYEYTRGQMDGIPVDDDLVYTQLGLLIMEEYGPNFTVADVGAAWLKYLQYACTAEEIALRNLKAGVPALKVAEKDNPYLEWIGADIRADPWAYMAPAWPQKAAEFAYRDAYISHRRNGIYGEMFFAAAEAAAFAVDDPIEAIEIGLGQIPKACRLAADVKWALKVGPKIKNHKAGRAAVDKRFAGMHAVHTNNNACLTIFGLFIGGKDVTKVIGHTVAMGLDNDCTAATAGSIVGAVVGKKGVPKHWTRQFNNKMHTFLIGQKTFMIDDVLERFAAQAQRIWKKC